MIVNAQSLCIQQQQSELKGSKKVGEGNLNIPQVAYRKTHSLNDAASLSGCDMMSFCYTHLLNSENTSTLTTQRPSITCWSSALCLLTDFSAANWNVVDTFLLLLWTVPVAGCTLSRMWLTGHFLLPFRHLSSCGILMTRTPRVLCLQDWDTMTAVPQSRNFISLTNKRKEYSERRILG